MPRPSPTPRSVPPVTAPGARGGVPGRPGPARRSAPGPRGPRAASRPAVPAPRPPQRVPAPRAARTDDEAVTVLVAGPGRRGRPGAVEGPGTGRGPALVGLVLGVLALLGAVVVAAEPAVRLPVLGRVGTSPLALAVLVAAGLLATACAAAGAGRHRSGWALGVTGMVVGLAAVAAAGLSLLAH